MTKQPHLFLDGFQYTHHKATSYGHMFRCTQKRSRLCPATARTNPDRKTSKLNTAILTRLIITRSSECRCRPTYEKMQQPAENKKYKYKQKKFFKKCKKINNIYITKYEKKRI